MRALVHIAVGHARRHRLQSALLVFGVALGVAVAVAIDLANNSALAGFRLSTAAITGRTTHQLVGGPRGLEEALYVRLRTELGLRAAAPVVEGVVTVEELAGRPMTLLGVDPFAEPPFRSFLVTDEPGSSPAAGEPALSPLVSFLTQPNTVLVAAEVAGEAGVTPGDQLTLVVGGQRVATTLVGLLSPTDDLSRRALRGLVLADISTAQEILASEGRLSRIDLLLPAGPERQAILAELRRLLPPGVSIVPASQQQAAVEEMTDAFELNLTALSLLALVVGVFLIFNTIRFSVVQRRTTLATLRALGVTRREIYTMILLEAAVLGIIGSLLGLGLGILLARGAVGLVTQAISDLYFVATVRQVPVPARSLVVGSSLGLVAALLAALWPAYEATAVPPVTALRRSEVEMGARRRAPRALWGTGGLVLVGGLLLAAPGRQVVLGLAALGTVVLAFALATPAFTLAVMAAAAPLTERLWGPVGRMAPRAVTRALSRTAVAIAALMVAVCVSIGLSIMVASFRLTVVRWLGDTLRADVFVTTPVFSAKAVGPGLEPQLVAELAALPEVKWLATAHDAVVRSPQLGDVEVIALSADIAGDRRWYVSAVGSADQVWAALEAGAIMITEPLARGHGLQVGDTLTLTTDRGPQAFPIAAVVRDYSSERGLVYLNRQVYLDGWHDPRISSVGLILNSGVDADRLAARLRQRYADQRLEIRSTRGLRREAMAVFDRAFAITTALRLLAIGVAFIGVLAALLALQLERFREFAILRATGLTTRQLAGLSLLETGLMGTVAGLLSWPAGLTLALLLIHVINRRSFGWTLLTWIDPWAFVQALLVAVAAALLAGAYPALALRRLPVARALREE